MQQYFNNNKKNKKRVVNGLKIENKKIKDFSQVNFKNIDLQQSILQGIKINIDNFKKITINPSQIVFIANSLGLSIKK